jgi:hypothetical protein
MFGQSETSSTILNEIILGLMMSGCRVGDSGSHVGGRFTFFRAVFEVRHILKLTAKHGLNNFSLQLFIGIKDNVYLSAAFKSLSIDPTDSLFNTSYSALIYTVTEVTFTEFLPKANYLEYQGSEWPFNVAVQLARCRHICVLVRKLMSMVFRTQ